MAENLDRRITQAVVVPDGEVDHSRAVTYVNFFDEESNPLDIHEPKVNRAGDTMTGPLTIRTSDTGKAVLSVNNTFGGIELKDAVFKPSGTVKFRDPTDPVHPDDLTRKASVVENNRYPVHTHNIFGGYDASWLSNPGTASASNSLVNLFVPGYEHWAPVYLLAGTYDRIGLVTTVAAAGTVRLGLDEMATDSARPGPTILVDAGVVDLGATAGLQAATISLTITKPGWYWARLKVETYTAAATIQIINGVGGNPGPRFPGWPTSISLGPRQLVGLSRTAALGAGPLAPTPSITGNSTTGLIYGQAAPRFFLRRSS